MTNIQKQLFMTSNAPKLQLKVNNHLWEDIPEILEVDQSSNSYDQSHAI